MELTAEQKAIGQSFTPEQLNAYNTYRAGGDEPAKAFSLTLQAYPTAAKAQGKTTAQKIAAVPSQIGKFVTSITGGDDILEATGQLIAAPEIEKNAEATRVQADSIAKELISKINDARASNDTARVVRLSQQLKNLDYGQNITKGFQDNLVTNEAIIGDAVQLASTAIGGFARPALATTKLANLAIPIEGAIQGAGFAAGESIKAKDDILTAVEKIIGGGALGFGGGALVQKAAPFIGKVGSKLSTYFKKGANDAVETVDNAIVGAIDETVTPPGTAQAVPPAAQAVDSTVQKTATRRGFSEADSNFLASLTDDEKKFARQAIDITEKAQTDKRALYGSRPIDLVGDNLVEKINPLRELESTFGKDVDAAARAIKGTPIDDVTPFRSNIETTLDDAGIIFNEGGDLDFSQSVFKNTPNLQKQIQTVIRNVPDGSDAYQVHIFKKSLDELINYGSQGEGLTGQAKNILQSLRSSADSLLDNQFPAYNTANTNFRNVREVLESVDDVLGKNLNKEKAAASLRRVFSNAQSRGDIKDVLAKIDEVAKAYKVNTNTNLYDQALLTEILEEIYGTQAITSFRGETEKAIKGVQTLVKGLRNPIEGIGAAAGDIVEYVSGQTPAARKKFLQELFGIINK